MAYFQSEAQQAQTQKELMFLFESKGRKELMSQFQSIQAGGILSYLEHSSPFCSNQVLQLTR